MSDGLQKDTAFCVEVEQDSSLKRVSLEEFRRESREIFNQVRSGRQVAIVDSSGEILAILGLNGIRLLEEPEFDLLDTLELEWESEEDQEVLQSYPWLD